MLPLGQEHPRCDFYPTPFCRRCVVNPATRHARLRIALPRATGDHHARALATARQAHATLADGCAFLMRPRAPGRAGLCHPASPALTSLRRAGNCLKELDRFLTLLLDACARASAMAPRDLAAFERWSNTAGKLRRISGPSAQSGAETQRLQAIDRLRRVACGDVCGRPRAMLIKDLAIATAGAARMPHAHPNPGHEPAESLSDSVLGVIAHFYLEIGNRLLLACIDSAQPLDFSSPKAHLEIANVACDGN